MGSTDASAEFVKKTDDLVRQTDNIAPPSPSPLAPQLSPEEQARLQDEAARRAREVRDRLRWEPYLKRSQMDPAKFSSEPGEITTQLEDYATQVVAGEERARVMQDNLHEYLGWYSEHIVEAIEQHGGKLPKSIVRSENAGWGTINTYYFPQVKYHREKGGQIVIDRLDITQTRGPDNKIHEDEKPDTKEDPRVIISFKNGEPQLIQLFWKSNHRTRKYSYEKDENGFDKKDESGLPIIHVEQPETTRQGIEEEIDDLSGIFVGSSYWAPYGESINSYTEIQLGDKPSITHAPVEFKRSGVNVIKRFYVDKSKLVKVAYEPLLGGFGRKITNTDSDGEPRTQSRVATTVPLRIVHRALNGLPNELSLPFPEERLKQMDQYFNYNS